MSVNTLQIRDRNTKLKGSESMQSTDFIFKENTHEYTEKRMVVTKVLTMPVSPGGGIMSDYFVILKSSQNNLRIKGFTINKILSLPVFT